MTPYSLKILFLFFRAFVVFEDEVTEHTQKRPKSASDKSILETKAQKDKLTT